MLQTLRQPLSSPLAAEEAKLPIYFVAWRIRKHHPWRSEEFHSRFEAHSRYFALLERAGSLLGETAVGGVLKF